MPGAVLVEQLVAVGLKASRRAEEHVHRPCVPCGVKVLAWDRNGQVGEAVEVEVARRYGRPKAVTRFGVVLDARAVLVPELVPGGIQTRGGTVQRVHRTGIDHAAVSSPAAPMARSAKRSPLKSPEARLVPGGAASTVVGSMATLSEGNRSTELVATLAVLLIVPAAVGCTTTGVRGPTAGPDDDEAHVGPAPSWVTSRPRVPGRRRRNTRLRPPRGRMRALRFARARLSYPVCRDLDGRVTGDMPPGPAKRSGRQADEPVDRLGIPLEAARSPRPPPG